ncbi:hypothetical protein RYX36_029240, partial [Vicia faba]
MGKEMQRVLEFYSGIGGMRYSLMKAQVEEQVIEAFEINNIANDVYQHNFSHRPYQILELIPFLLRPPSMLFVENVVGFETSDTHAKLIEILEKTNFITQEFILSSLQFGVPYSRPCYFCLAKRKPSSFGNEFLSRQLIQSPKPLFEPFNAYAKEDDLSLEDRHNLFQSCQPIEKFLVLKNLSNDTNVEPEASATGVSNDISRTSGEDEYNSLDKYYVHPSLLERWGSAM